MNKSLALLALAAAAAEAADPLTFVGTALVKTAATGKTLQAIMDGGCGQIHPGTHSATLVELQAGIGGLPDSVPSDSNAIVDAGDGVHMCIETKGLPKDGYTVNGVLTNQRLQATTSDGSTVSFTQAQLDAFLKSLQGGGRRLLQFPFGFQQPFQPGFGPYGVQQPPSVPTATPFPLTAPTVVIQGSGLPQQARPEVMVKKLGLATPWGETIFCNPVNYQAAICISGGDPVPAPTTKPTAAATAQPTVRPTARPTAAPVTGTTPAQAVTVSPICYDGVQSGAFADTYRACGYSLTQVTTTPNRASVCSSACSAAAAAARVACSQDKAYAASFNAFVQAHNLMVASTCPSATPAPTNPPAPAVSNGFFNVAQPAFNPYQQQQQSFSSYGFPAYNVGSYGLYGGMFGGNFAQPSTPVATQANTFFNQQPAQTYNPYGAYNFGFAQSPAWGYNPAGFNSFGNSFGFSYFGR